MFRYHLKFLILKNHFELKNYEIAREASISFRKYVKRDENLNDMRRAKTNYFLDFYSILWKHYENRPPVAEIEKTINELKKNSPIPESDWLLSKFNELISTK